MRRTTLLFFLGAMCFLSVYPQSRNTAGHDSLQHIYERINESLDRYEYTKSLQNSRELIKLASEYGNHYYLYHGYNLLGVTYAQLEDTARAKDNYLKSLEHAKASKNDTILWWAYNNMGNVYSQDKKTVEKGLRYYDRAIAIAMRLNDTVEGIDPIINKAWTHLDYKHFTMALPYLVQAKKLIGPNTADYVKSSLDAQFGRYFAGKENYERSRCFFESAIQIAERDSLYSEASFALKEYSKMLFASGDYKSAYRALNKHLKYEDKIFEREKLHQMEVASTRFEIAEYRKDLEIARKEQEYQDDLLVKTRQISIILVCSFSVLLLFFLMLFKNNRSRKVLINRLKEFNHEIHAEKERAERLSTTKTRFFSTVSHELRTPLYGVVGLTSLLLEENTNKEQEEDLKSLKFSADYLLALINDVLQVNKMESELVQLENMPFNIENVMKGLVKSFEFSRHQNRNIIDLQIDEKIPRNLIGDSVRLSQVLMNLVGNAIKFTECGKIWIKAECKKCNDQKCTVYFEVGDTGIGIPRDKQKEIFEEFSQLRTANYNYQGTGLGLPIVKKLLHLFKSNINLKSKEGKGSVFGFEIEFEKGEAPAVIPEAVEHIENNPILPDNFVKKALIVDDNRINQVITQRILEKRDFQCQVANNGPAAIAILKKEDFDIVLMDVNMPGMNGLETTREIRKFNAGIPIIALTAVEIDEMRDGILASGMNDIIVKPYDTSQFFHTIFRNLLVKAEMQDG